jgi:acyl phosphate:glycerol-3-phosphate acyltransferase
VVGGPHPAVIVVLLAAYLVGGIPFGVLLARRRGVDLRARGSGNIGATNAARSLGLATGLAVLALDAAKGALAVVIAMRVTPDPAVVALIGFAAIAGHCFSPFLGFRGGKGVATTLGVFTALAPPLALVGLGVFLVVAGRTRVVALGSLAGVGAAVVAAFAAYPEHRVLALVTFALLVYTHRANLASLRDRS